MAISPEEARSQNLAKVKQYADYLEKRIDETLSTKPDLENVVFLYYKSFRADKMPFNSEKSFLSPAVEAEVARRYVAKGWKKVWFEGDHFSGNSDATLKVHFE